MVGKIIFEPTLKMKPLLDLIINPLELLIITETPRAEINRTVTSPNVSNAR